MVELNMMKKMKLIQTVITFDKDELERAMNLEEIETIEKLFGFGIVLLTGVFVSLGFMFKSRHTGGTFLLDVILLTFFYIFSFLILQNFLQLQVGILLKLTKIKEEEQNGITIPEEEIEESNKETSST